MLVEEPVAVAVVPDDTETEVDTSLNVVEIAVVELTGNGGSDVAVGHSSVLFAAQLRRG